MLKRIKNYLLLTVASLTLTVPVLIPAMPASADVCGNVGSNIATGINFTQGTNSAGQQCGQGGDVKSGISTLAAQIVNLFSIIVGVVSVVMIIYAGFRYITSGGESNSVSGAKNTLIFAIIGLVIVAIAQLIVRYVLNSASNVPTS
jgi:cytochrome bd-type quinol oxidase subunit 2